MIKVKIVKENVEIEEILISGHAGYAKYGYDIVCSAVSSVVTTTINGILSFSKTIEVLDDGDILKIHILTHDLVTDKLILNMLNLLQEIEKQYKKNISIRTEEKKC